MPPPLLQLYILSFLCVIRLQVRLHAAAALFDAVSQKAFWEFECGIPLFFFHSFFHIFYIFFGLLFSFLLKYDSLETMLKLVKKKG